MSQTLITSRDPKGLHFMSIVEAAYNKAELDSSAAQLLNERGDEVKTGISELITKLTTSNQYTDEEVESSHGYHSGYTKPKTIQDQLRRLEELFPACGAALAKMEVLAEPLPSGAEGWFAIPRWGSIAPTYGQAVQKVLDLLSKMYGYRFTNSREGQLGSQNLRQSSESVAAWEKIRANQPFDNLIVAAQFGIRHRGRSVRRARAVMGPSEFRLGAFAVGIMLLTHENRLRHYDDLWIDCAGDEFHDPQILSGPPFNLAPCFFFDGGSLRFDTGWSNIANGHCGSASGWVV